MGGLLWNFVVKKRVHAAGNQTFLPKPATFKLRCYLWELSLIVASPGHRTQFTFQKYPCLGPQMTTSGDFPAKTIPYTHTVFKWSWPQVVAHNPTHDTNMATTLHMIPTWPTTLHMMPTYNLISLLDTSLVRVIWSNTALR